MDRGRPYQHQTCQDTLDYLVLPELSYDGFMQEETDVFQQVERPRSSGALVHLLLVFGLMWINAFQDTQPSAEQIETKSRFEKVKTREG